MSVLTNFEWPRICFETLRQRAKNKISLTPQVSSKLVHTKRYHFWFSLKGSKVNVPQVAIFDKNMAVRKSKNLVMLHVHKLEKDHATFF